MKTRLGILTGGGDVPPLNAVIYFAYESGKSSGTEVVGLAGGWQGLLDCSTVNLGSLNLDPMIGGTVLRSSRVNLGKVDDAHGRITKSIAELGLDGLIVIGGDDTLSNAFYLEDVPQVLISKTIDNDVGINEPGRIINYFTLGYPTAAQKISSFVSLREGLRTTAYSHERIMVVESMGMHAGWLGIASAMGHPDYTIIPEFPLDYDLLRAKVTDRYRSQRNVMIVISEGSKWSNGEHISADEDDRDDFGHPKFKGAASLLAGRLRKDLASEFDTRNVNSVNPSYLYRSGKPNPLDLEAAAMLGRDAVRILSGGISEPAFLTLKYTGGGFESDIFHLKELGDIEGFHRFVDRRYYDPAEFKVTPEAVEYLGRITTDLGGPIYGFQQSDKETK
ncbi:MAG: 6-phosphofructokinase [Bacteroidetes bacterium]|nr:6-phosphofructokinase [Bacteroidota bacterium]